MGRAILDQLAEIDGCQIIACSRNPESLKDAIATIRPVASINVAAIDLEWSDGEIAKAVSTYFTIFSGIDVLINCAGMGFRGRVTDTLLETDRRLMQVDYFGQIAVIKTLIGKWKELGTDKGHIIQISSVQGFFGLGERAPYSAAKHAMVGFVDSLRVELDSHPEHSNYRVTHVCPGHIATNHSLNAIMGDGSRYNIKDANMAEGYEPSKVAKELLSRCSIGEREIIIAPMKVKTVMVLRALAPLLCFRLLRNAFVGKRESFLKSITKWLLNLE